MTIRGLHHAQITVPKGAEEKARRFYCDLLGLMEIPKPNTLSDRGGFWLRLSNADLHVGTEDGLDRNRTKAHLAYEVEDLSRWRLRLEEAGVPIVESVPIPGFDRFELRDPFGNRLELIEQKNRK
ncbi:VOC family protein [Desmospora profundinema]|uniref:Catechol 2,3-dioxygenase-like lactoylglutathione lyase family enzyme n=1 Tax=Desmospora profundinema TaxID=1571184 RepID=A0ABU1IML6_9BACL|nr:VOC family protein [Desmospora profundinema]MDR6226020.1 catechol 2,3-dioxygenase-like lactoylglutathione lyase family enzyme [Desmospora profundinema]